MEYNGQLRSEVDLQVDTTPRLGFIDQGTKKMPGQFYPRSMDNIRRDLRKLENLVKGWREQENDNKAVVDIILGKQNSAGDTWFK